MVEKVAATTDTSEKASPAVTGTQEKPAVSGTGTGTGSGVAQGGSQTGGGGAGSGSSSEGKISPLENHMVHGEHMADPNGNCQACGRPCPADARTCPNCEENPISWNQKVKDNEKAWRDAGWDDDKIRNEGGRVFDEYKAQGVNAEFYKKLEDEEVKKALGE